MLCRDCGNPMACMQPLVFLQAFVCILHVRTTFGARARFEVDDPELKLEDTNVARIGSEQDRAIRKTAALTEPAWAGAGMKPGIEVWRIMQFKVVKWPEEQHGQFYENDAYIVLRTVSIDLAEGSPASKAFGSGNKLVRSIHFWLGEGSAIDERGVAAYKTVELDSIFDGGATQHREVMRAESEEFKDLFKDGLTYLTGGTESGFRHAEKNTFDTKLYQVRRTHSHALVVYEMPVSKHSINQDDCFVLASGLNIFKFEGRRTSAFSKFKANDIASYIRSQRPHSTLMMVEDKEPSEEQMAQDPFWSSLESNGKVRDHGEVSDETAAVEGTLSPDFNDRAEKRGVPGPQFYQVKGNETMSIANGTDVHHLVSSWIADPALRDSAATYMLLYGPIQAELFILSGTDVIDTLTAAKHNLYKWGMSMDTPTHVFVWGQMILNKQFAEF